MSDKTPADYFTSDDSDLNVKKDTTSGELKLQGHEHTWTYAATGSNGIQNIITATCSSMVGTCGLSDDKVGGTYTITAPSSLIYSGETKEATVTSSPVSGVTLPTAPTITYTKSGESNFTGKPKDAGTYTASITLDNATAYVTYTITKATPDAEDFSFTAPENRTYDGHAKSATVTSGKTGMGEITVNYYNGETKLDGAPTDVGTYTVKISVAEGTNYNAATNLTADSWTFTITKADYTGDKTANGSAIYGNSGSVNLSSLIASAPDNNVKATAEITGAEDNDHILRTQTPYSIANGTLTYYLADNAAVGKTAKIFVKVSNCLNYNDYTITVTVTVENKNTNDSAMHVSLAGWTFGSPNTPSVTG